jgi:hypothetical protein
VDDMPESICPCHNHTMGLVMEIIDQVRFSSTIKDVAIIDQRTLFCKKVIFQIRIFID